MVATIHKLTAGFTGDYYMRPLAADYYLGEEQSRGTWHGGLTEILQLHGSVHEEAFKRILAGKHPTRDKVLVESKNPKRVPGVDITFSTPKCVSTLWAVSEPQVAKRIEGCVMAAVTDTLSFAEENLNLKRSGKGEYSSTKARCLLLFFRTLQIDAVNLISMSTQSSLT